MDKPISLRSIVFHDINGISIVKEEYSLTFSSHEYAEKFIDERKEYWTNILGIKLVITPMQNETIEEIEIQKVFKLTARAMGISSQFIFRRTRSAAIIEVRRTAIAICVEFGLSVSVIGNAIGFDHSTIIHHRDKFYGLCEYEPGYEDKYNEIKDKVLKKMNGSFSEDGSGKKIEQ